MDNALKPKHEDNIQLVYTDTDSYVSKTDNDDVHEDLKEISEYISFSDYHPSHPIYDKTNQKVLGKFKDELNGRISFTGLRPKSCCSQVHSEEKEHKKKKRVKKTSE